MEFLIATNFAPLITTAARQVKFHIQAGTTTISSICDGATPLIWAINRLTGNFLLVGAIVATAVTLVN